MRGTVTSPTRTDTTTCTIHPRLLNPVKCDGLAWRIETTKLSDETPKPVHSQCFVGSSPATHSVPFCGHSQSRFSLCRPCDSIE
ncbi:hypothetical protein DMENIID0001_020710 [Sergentomyia squamirostris]